jgi:hypothetical protein
MKTATEPSAAGRGCRHLHRPDDAPTGAQNIVVVFSPGPTYTLTGGLTIQ